MRPFLFALSAVATLSSVACSGASSDANADPNARPAGCKKTECDADYDQCKASETDHCSKCNAQCGGMDDSVLMSCLETCNEICAEPPSTLCIDERTMCRKSAKNAACIDGLAPNDVPGLPTWSATFAPPAPRQPGACAEADLAAFLDACQSSDATKMRCSTFESSRPACTTCLLTSAKDDVWGPLVTNDLGGSWLNSEGCVATLAGDGACASKIYAANACLSGCTGADDQEACATFAAAHDCRDEAQAAAACSHDLGLDRSPSKYDVCGVNGAFATGDATLSVLRFFCGNAP